MLLPEVDDAAFDKLHPAIRSRYMRIYRMRQRGMRVKEIARAEHVSKPRISQILNRILRQFKRQGTIDSHGPVLSLAPVPKGRREPQGIVTDSLTVATIQHVWAEITRDPRQTVRQLAKTSGHSYSTVRGVQRWLVNAGYLKDKPFASKGIPWTVLVPFAYIKKETQS